MTSLIIEARRVTLYEVSILGDDIFSTLERIESKQPYYKALFKRVLRMEIHVHQLTSLQIHPAWMDPE